MARKKQERATANSRRERVWKQWVRGKSETEIAAAEGVVVSTICRDLQARREQIREHEAASADKAVAQRDRAIGTYQEAIAEAWSEWERSKLDKKRQRHKAKQGGEGETSSEAEETTEGRLGDPQYLRTIIQAQARIDEWVMADMQAAAAARLAEALEAEIQTRVERQTPKMITDAREGIAVDRGPPSTGPS